MTDANDFMHPESSTTTDPIDPKEIIPASLENVLNSTNPHEFVNTILETTIEEATKGVEETVKMNPNLTIEKMDINTQNSLQMRDIHGALVTGGADFSEFPYFYLIGNNAANTKIPHSMVAIFAKLSDNRVVAYIGKRTKPQQYVSSTVLQNEIIRF